MAVCCWRVLSCPPADTQLQPLQMSCEEALGQLMSALLQAEGTSCAFADMVSVSTRGAELGPSGMLRGGSVPCCDARAGKGTGPAGGRAKSQAGTGRCRWGNGSWGRAGGWQCRCLAGLGPRGAPGQGPGEEGGRQRGVAGEKEGRPSRDTSAPPQDLLYHLTARKRWQQERALQLCAQLLGTYEELFERSKELACSGFGSLLGVLGPLLSDSRATSRQRAGACLSCLLRIQACGLARAQRVVLQVPDIKELCERLDTVEDRPLREDRAEIAEDVCQYLPEGQARSFMDSIMKTVSCTNQRHARAAGDWLVAFLETRRNDVYPEVPKFMKILWEARRTVQQRPLKDRLLKAICLLAGFHIQPVVDTLLQAESSSARYVRSPLAPPWPPNSNPTACLQWGDPGRQQVPFLPQKPELCEIGRSCLWGSRRRVPCCWRGERLASGEGGHQGSQRTGLTGERLFACRDVVRLWRSLGSSDLGPKVLYHLILTLDKASEARRRLTVAAQLLDPLKVCPSAGASLQLPTCFLT
ncbi:Maestro heat-like repeat-containing protein family member 2B [Aix galericulata]|nr:Maestro heat-like repeat-containing protein family member 2B [Aix galericulata]